MIALMLGRSPWNGDFPLHTIILPATGMKGYDDFLSRFLQRIHTVWKPFRLDFDPATQTVITLRRTDRSYQHDLEWRKKDAEMLRKLDML
jgi:hypothetical protein